MRLFFALTAMAFVMGKPAIAQSTAPQCDPTPSNHAVRIQGLDNSFPFVAGDQEFYQALDNGWVFALVRAENGWSVRLFDEEPVGDAVDLTSMTPPLRGAPNPRDIFGWHFRNAANTGPNEGDVNAPQRLRAFVISPALSGTGGYKPSDNEPRPPSPNDGIGWLKLVDFGLANPSPGTRARMNYLQFDACLSWPRTSNERDKLIDQASLEFTAEDREEFGSCGLDLDRYSLAAPFAPRQLSGDFDGDDAGDAIARIKRISDGQHGLAICRAGTWHDVIGFEPFQDLRSGYIDQMESWTWFEANGDIPRQLIGYELPQSDGPYILLERIEKEAILLFWRNGEWHAKKIFGHVEP